ncbi:hypothetical protein POTOM_006176 [Populus tomentosa]|uniref:Uncharacterized protein n=1 Tax=Populus tomentosa TaxID=118781 RepID=A0A8X8AIF8_POPTO|nr:hypothetical protein POTOM_006176 [Populus tomentosa]
MWYCYGGLSKGCKVEISAPKLTFLSYKESHVVDFSVINLPSLQHADVDVFLSYEEENEDIQYLLKFFQGLYNVQSATLSYSTIQALNGVPGLEHQQSPFSRLSLKLTHPSDCPFPIPVKVAKYLCNGSPTPDTILAKWPKFALPRTFEVPWGISFEVLFDHACLFIRYDQLWLFFPYSRV